MASWPTRLSAFRLTPAAWNELDAIWKYIAKNSERHADLVEEAIFDTCRSAAAMPMLGHRRREIRDDRILFRVVTEYDRYSIAYLRDSKPLQVVRVLHGSRDVRRLFKKHQ